uniref:Predicted protein n=1 Tax=Hordeum vulgare subsp. vulgare TaxID=112509 RepID=F2CT84_HORVV|nr:predicted protein [Hordeum vulgare subsp. vulgare]
MWKKERKERERDPTGGPRPHQSVREAIASWLSGNGPARTTLSLRENVLFKRARLAELPGATVEILFFQMGP